MANNMTVHTTNKTILNGVNKKRALEYVDDGDLTNAYASFISDMSKHDETANNMALKMGNALFFSGQLSTIGDMRRWINGF